MELKFEIPIGTPESELTIADFSGSVIEFYNQLIQDGYSKESATVRSAEMLSEVYPNLKFAYTKEKGKRVSKNLSLKESIEYLEELGMDKARIVILADWIAHKIAKRQAYAKIGISSLYKRCCNVSVQSLSDGVISSISNGYTGLFFENKTESKQVTQPLSREI